MNAITILGFGLSILALFTGVSTGQDKKSPEAEQWLAYEDQTLRFEYPKGWKFRMPDYLVVEQRVREVTPPDGGFLNWGAISIYEDLKGLERRPLSKIAAEGESGSHKFIDTPKPLRLKGADCLRYATEGRVVHTGVLSSHIETFVVADCYDKRKRHFSISSHLSRYFERGKPDELTIRNRQIFDHLVQSLEFKQVAESTSTRREK